MKLKTSRGFPVIFITLLLVVAFPASGATTKAAKSITWFDAFNYCQKQTPTERDQAFNVETRQWPNIGGGVPERATAHGVDFWYEPIPAGLPGTVKIVRGVLGAAYATLSECKHSGYKNIKLVVTKIDRKLLEGASWYRARLHKRSCDLTPLTFEQVNTWYVKNLAHLGHSGKCSLRLENGPDGNAIFITCGKQTEYLTDSQKGCDALLEYIQENSGPSTPAEDEQFGWE